MTWIAIAEEWEKKTGKATWDSTMRKRHAKLKASLARVKDEHLNLMKATAERVKAEIEEEKKVLDKKLWVRVSAAMEEAGVEKYEPVTLEKAYKLALGSSGGSSSTAVNGAIITDDKSNTDDI
jgi:hypothetical protein